MNVVVAKFLGCEGKHAYKSMARAEKAAKDYCWDFPHLAAGINSYHCTFCDKFHIGHTNKKNRSVRAIDRLRETIAKGQKP